MPGRLAYGQKKPFAQHVAELNRRLLYGIGSIFLFSSIAYGYRDQIIAFLIGPLRQPLYYTSPSGAFDFVIDVSLAVGVIASLPVLIYNFFRFAEPALPSRASINIIRLVAASYLLAILGAAMAYEIALPETLHFLGSFTYTGLVQPLIGASSYFTFTLFYVVGFAVIFQVPIIMLLINQLRPIAKRELMALQRWVILISFILAAFINPAPDPVTQAVTAVPLILLYEVGVIAVVVANRKQA